MSRKRTNQEQREAFEELQQRKKRKLENARDRQSLDEDGKTRSRKRRKNKNRNRNNVRRRGRAKPHKVGLTLVTIQAIVSMLCVGMLHIIGIIPLKYMRIIGGILLLLLGLTLFTQLNRKKKAITRIK